MQKTKTAMITLCGRPNVGKSSLTNALVGEKIAIVSNKPQTTRNRIYGVVTEGDTQLVLLDTPGFHKPRSRLGDYMVKVARDSIADVDLVALLVEPVPHVGIPEQELIEKIQQSSLPAVCASTRSTPLRKRTTCSPLSLPTARCMISTAFSPSPRARATGWTSCWTNSRSTPSKARSSSLTA